MIGDHHSVYHHSDLNKPRIAKDEADVNSIIDMLQNNWVSPFDTSVKDLVSLSTAAAPNAEISKDLLNAKERGEAAYTIFKTERLENNYQKFHGKMTKMNLKSFSDLKKKGRNVKIHGKETILRADRNLFSNMIIAAQSRKLNMREVLCHPLGPLPWSLATPEGHPRKTSKSILGSELAKNVPEAETLPLPRACIIDGIAIVNKIQGDKKTFQEISDSVLALVLKEGKECKRIDVVFDVYRDVSIKNVERSARAKEEEVPTYKHISQGTKVIQWHSFLKNSSNKTHLISFMVSQWKMERCRKRLIENNIVLYATCEEMCFKMTAESVECIDELSSSQEEADTRMLLHAMHISRYAYKAIVIISVDTDVRVLCLYLAKDIPLIIFQKCGTDARTQFLNITNLARDLGEDMCGALVGLHAFTGCDSISAFAGKGKLSALKLVIKNKDYQDLFKCVGQEWKLSEDVLRKIQAFTCVWYGAKDDTVLVNEYRYKLFCAKKGEVESFQLPPCLDTLAKHTSRVCYQAAIWRRSLQQSQEVPSPVGMGWQMEEKDGLLNLDWMDGKPAPVAVLQLLACKCPRTCKAEDCQCISNGLFCTDLCRHKVCTNLPPEDDLGALTDKEDSDFSEGFSE